MGKVAERGLKAAFYPCSQTEPGGQGARLAGPEGKVSEVLLGDVKRGLSPEAESQGLSLGASSGQASCP